MKVLIVLAALLLSSSLFAQEKQLGVGLMLGNPTGVNGKYWLSEDRAVDGGIGFSMLGNSSDLSIHSDYLLHKFSAFYLNDVHALDLYYGIGGRMEFDDDIQIGVRVPVGLSHKLNNGEADLFAELAPIIDIFATSGLEVHALVGARYYF